jgi:hypothetical protein
MRLHVWHILCYTWGVIHEATGVTNDELTGEGVTSDK